jgi:hypothetical protein
MLIFIPEPSVCLCFCRSGVSIVSIACLVSYVGRFATVIALDEIKKSFVESNNAGKSREGGRHVLCSFGRAPSSHHLMSRVSASKAIV